MNKIHRLTFWSGTLWSRFDSNNSHFFKDGDDLVFPNIFGGDVLDFENVKVELEGIDDRKWNLDEITINLIGDMISEDLVTLLIFDESDAIMFKIKYGDAIEKMYGEWE